MMQMIVGTIKNAVKLDMLSKNWEQKKNSGNFLLKQERNALANMSPEQRMVKQFQEDLMRNKEQSKNNEIANKVMNGEDLTPEEEQYLAQNNPAQLSNYRQMQAEKHAYAEKLRACKTKDEVQRLKANTMSAYLAELKSAPGGAKAAKAMEILGKVRVIEKAEAKFVKSGAYAKLPTEADEAIERAEEKSEENAENLEKLMDAAENDELNKAEDTTELEKAEDESSVNKSEEKAFDNKEANADKMDDKENINKSIHHTKNKRSTEAQKTAKEALEEIETICKSYIPNIGSKKESTPDTSIPKPKEIETGSKIDKRI